MRLAAVPLVLRLCHCPVGHFQLRSGYILRALFVLIVDTSDDGNAAAAAHPVT